MHLMVLGAPRLMKKQLKELLEHVLMHLMVLGAP